MYENHSMNLQQRYIYKEKFGRRTNFNSPFQAKGGKNENFIAPALSEEIFCAQIGCSEQF